MSELDKVKQDIIDIVENSGDVTFGGAWICRRLNAYRKENGDHPLRDYVVEAVLQSMIDDGTVECVELDSYILLAPEPEENMPPVTGNTYNITINFIINSTDNSDNSLRIRKGK